MARSNERRTWSVGEYGDSVSGGIVSLLTDFGLTDSYVGQVKGVIVGLAPGISLVDLTHEIPPQDVQEGAFQLATAWSAFPEGTVHLAVVDPGVGTDRRAIAFSYRGHLFVLPDNGLATLVLGSDLPDLAVVLDQPESQRSRVSTTFHGRDIFAPVAARLARGADLEDVGTAVPTGSLVALNIPGIERGADFVSGPVVSIDHFGNCRTLIRPDDLPWSHDKVSVRCRAAWTHRIVDAYGAVPEGQTLALFGSHGGLEVAVSMGNAAQAWGIKRNMRVEVRPDVP